MIWFILSIALTLTLNTTNKNCIMQNQWSISAVSFVYNIHWNHWWILMREKHILYFSGCCWREVKVFQRNKSIITKFHFTHQKVFLNICRISYNFVTLETVQALLRNKQLFLEQLYLIVQIDFFFVYAFVQYLIFQKNCKKKIVVFLLE